MHAGRLYVCRFVLIQRAPLRTIGISGSFRMPQCRRKRASCVTFPSGLDIVGDVAYIAWGHNDDEAFMTTVPLSYVLDLCVPP